MEALMISHHVRLASAKTTAKKSNHSVATKLLAAAMAPFLVLVAASTLSGCGFDLTKLTEDAKTQSAAEVDTTQLAKTVKKQMGVPKKLDKYTTITNVTGGDHSITYHYTLHNLPRGAGLTTKKLKGTIRPSLCANQESLGLLKSGIKMKYRYVVRGTSTTYAFTVSQGDCT
jgi:hypothetical protein